MDLSSVKTWNDEKVMRNALGNGKGPYQDDIHLSTAGQRMLAEILSDIVHQSI